CLPMSYVAFLRRKRPPLKSSRSLTDHLRESIASVQHQIGLLGSVLWWYLAPLALSWMLVFVDRVRSARLLAGAYSGPELLFSAAFAVAIFVGVWKLNERAVRKDLEPRLRELEKTLTELES
ncbi:MAG TPA: hypothetical protein VGQ82_04435, partial [Chthoniobacterales bacterium]|nr:hypothetical protein [Chthoniobacterales bacterium]